MRVGEHSNIPVVADSRGARRDQAVLLGMLLKLHAVEGAHADRLEGEVGVAVASNQHQRKLTACRQTASQT